MGYHDVYDDIIISGIIFNIIYAEIMTMTKEERDDREEIIIRRRIIMTISLSWEQ